VSLYAGLKAYRVCKVSLFSVEKSSHHHHHHHHHHLEVTQAVNKAHVTSYIIVTHYTQDIITESNQMCLLTEIQGWPKLLQEKLWHFVWPPCTY